MKPRKNPIPKICAATLAFAVAASVATAPGAHAQPDPNNAPKAVNPDNRPVRPRLTREQRAAQREEQRKRQMARQLEGIGITDKGQQEAVINYINGETDATDKLQTSARALATALRTEAVTDQQVAVLLNDYNVAVDDNRARRKAAQKKLNEGVDLLKNPRLEAFLTLMGLYGDAPAQGGNWMRGRG